MSLLINSKFSPNNWIKNRHLQTVWCVLFRKLPKLPKMQTVEIKLSDGDFIDVEMYFDSKHPLALLIHGLEGSKDSHYIRGLASTLIKDNYSVAIFHFRGCSDRNNLLLRSYHSGVSDDLQEVLHKLAEKHYVVEYLVGFSLGGNVLLKWLGEQHLSHQVKAAVAVSVPLLLDESARAIDSGFSKLYSWNLLKTLKQKALMKKKQYPDKIALSPKQITKLKTFWAFDEQITAPIHGFSGAKEYYQKCSSQQFLIDISIPTLIIHAKDDPFMNHKVIPDASLLSHQVIFELAEHGGHVGFVDVRFPWRLEYYLEQRIPEFLQSFSMK